jgi:hypothetical protein
VFAKIVEGTWLVVLQSGTERKEMKGDGDFDIALTQTFGSLKQPCSIRLYTKEPLPTPLMKKFSVIARSKGHTLAFTIAR